MIELTKDVFRINGERMHRQMAPLSMSSGDGYAASLTFFVMNLGTSFFLELRSMSGGPLVI